MKYLITGGAGFLGSNIAAELINSGQKLTVFDNLSRYGSKDNLLWLKSLGKFDFVNRDIRNRKVLTGTIKRLKPEIIIHLAGQVAMTTSLSDPYSDFEINAQGSLNVLEAVRLHSRKTGIIYSSTNKVYGDIEWAKYKEQAKRYVCLDYPKGLSECIPLSFHSPYGCSKGSADQYMLDYHRMYGLKTAVFRHSSMYGGRQFSTYDQGWIGWFCQKALEIQNGTLKKQFTVSGNGKQVRDVLYSSDMVELYLKAAGKIEAISGNAFNIGGGIENSLSLLELFTFLEKELAIKMVYKRIPVRESDQKVFVADISKAKKMLGWVPKTDKYEGIRGMLKWLREKK